ncbi:hypothetical protein [Pseudaquabacterium rugosum]|uniref:Uncharacterized protein n=1 Tax=Pseudaquabacterium rugosum TaxID=2984194 RepID=A0ABU9BCB3_9BURK
MSISLIGGALRRAPSRLRARLRRAARPLLPALVATLLAALGGVWPAAAGAAGVSAPDTLTLLVPDGADLGAWQAKVWIDSAAEEGLRLQIITDSQLLALGSAAAQKIAGLIVPDSAHLRASEAVIAAVKQYAYTGGRLMLVYDAGALTAAGTFPASGPNRFSDLVGLDYTLWNSGAGAATMVGFGPVVGTRARLDSLQVPPGKYLPYQAPLSLSTTAASTAFVAATAADPGGSTRMADVLRARVGKGADEGSARVRQRRNAEFARLLGLNIEPNPAVRYDRRNTAAWPARSYHVYDRRLLSGAEVDAVLNADGASATERTVSAGTVGDGSLQAISGYGYGALGYYSYVTTGTFPGTVYLSSPEHGLVAGVRGYGSGQVLFVNLPLGYFKAMGTDGMLLHGFLDHFGRDLVGAASMSVQPRAQGGLVYNWHIDDGDDLRVDTQALLDRSTVFRRGPYSLHLTAGPDVISFGDGNGMNLDADSTSQALVRRLAGIKVWSQGKSVPHVLGSHGGWIHDYWGANASETNASEMTWLLQRNFDAIERVTGQRITEYSSPVGNTPTWAVQWLENRGVKAMYLTGDSGSGVVRSWRSGARLTRDLWTMPITPQGRWATFEEFDINGVGDATTGQWLLDLQSFAVNHRTARMFYNHPPGALGHLNPLNAVLTRGDRLQANGRFSWYTMTGLAEFSQKRLQTSWDAGMAWGLAWFSAGNAAGLADQSWLLPKSRYYLPVVISGNGTVQADATNWIVIAEGGTQIRFTALPR